MLNIILFGPPGSGKGTQAEKIADKYGLLHISTGDLFRAEMSNNTPLGIKAKQYMAQGHLVPDEVTIGMLENKVNANLEVNGYIFDGFPRTPNQAQSLDTFLLSKDTKVSILLALDVSDAEIVTRILNRGVTSGREDDNDESIIRNRIEVYTKETLPIFTHYQNLDRAVKIDGIGSIDEIFQRISTILDRFVST